MATRKTKTARRQHIRLILKVKAAAKRLYDQLMQPSYRFTFKKSDGSSVTLDEMGQVREYVRSMGKPR